MTDDERPRHGDDDRDAVQAEHHHEPHEGEQLTDDPHASSVPDVAIYEGGIPAVMWSAYRLGDKDIYALCANVLKPAEITFWLCASIKDPHDEKAKVWRPLAQIARVERGGEDSVYDAPECWLTAGRLRLTTLIYPVDEWASYTIEGMP